VKISKDRLIPPVESSGRSSSRGIADARLHPQIPPTRQEFNRLVVAFFDRNLGSGPAHTTKAKLLGAQ
jgi:hypothetical protein